MSNIVEDAAFVSSDIVGHGKEHSHKKQEKRIKAINKIITEACGDPLGKGIIWASGGDGGHVAFFRKCESRRGLTLSLINDLFRWAQEENRASDADFKLRLTAHYGPVSTIVGADGRDQLVGDGINYCGSLLGFGTPDAVIVSSAFKEFINCGRSEGADRFCDDIRFHDEQIVYLKHFELSRICCMSFGDELKSKKSSPEKSDRILLEEACELREKELFWQIIYHAKRLLQIDASNKEAVQAITAISPEELQTSKTNYSDRETKSIPHPLFKWMDRTDLEKIVKSAHLIERDDGEVICKRGDSGDTMFIVLRGHVGVILGDDNDNGNSKKLNNMVDLRFGEGAILGELALAFQSKRTATLQAIGHTALLAINYDILTYLLKKEDDDEMDEEEDYSLKKTFNSFLNSRVLEFLCRRVTYLSIDKDGPLARFKAQEPWNEFNKFSRRIDYNWNKTPIISHDDKKLKMKGIYILIKGSLKEVSKSDKAKKEFHGKDFPLIFVNLPQLISTQYKYWISSENVSILRISYKAINRVLKGREKFSVFGQALIRQLNSQCLFDVFISFVSEDEHIARHWGDAMKEADLKVYISVPEPGDDFEDEIKVAIKDSRVLLPFLSNNVLNPKNKNNWVKKEIMMRREYFAESSCNFLPVELNKGVTEKLLSGKTPIRTLEGEQAAIEEAIQKIKFYRDKKPPPLVHSSM